jgi:hypothetical protein
MTAPLVSPFGQYVKPAFTLPPTQLNNSRGLCSLTFGNNTLNFRTNPNSVTWDYNLVTHVQPTYGGRVVQILGVNMDHLSVKVDCGMGGWPYAMQVVQFMRDMMVTQRNGESGTFVYTTRGWHLKVFALNVPFADEVTSTVRELELEFKIQEDVSGLAVRASLTDALRRLSNGVGFYLNGYNNPDPGTIDSLQGGRPGETPEVTPPTVARAKQ